VLILKKTGTVIKQYRGDIIYRRGLEGYKEEYAQALEEREDYLSKKDKRVDFIDSFKKELREAVSADEVHKRELRLEIVYYNICYGTTRSFVELKVGLDKTYIVKSMKAFLNSIEYGDTLEFGKNFTFDMSCQRFSERDNKIIELFREINEVDGGYAYQHSSYGGGGTLIAGKRLALTDKQLYKFLYLLEGSCFDAVIGDTEYNSVAVLREKMPLIFKLDVKNENIELSYEGEMPLALGGDFNSFWHVNTIYLPPKNQIRLYEPFYKLLLNKKKTVFSRGEFDILASYIVPALKGISSEVILDKELGKSLYEAPMVPQVYLDKWGDFITASVSFNYGDISLNPLEEEAVKSSKGVLLRDIAKEETWGKILRSFGFEENEKQYLMQDEKHIVSFITEGVRKLQEFGEVYYSDGFKDIRVYSSLGVRAGVSLNEEDLLEFSFELEGVDRAELKDILNAIREKRKYYRLKKGGFISLEDRELQDIAQMLSCLNIKDNELLKDSVLLPKYNALYIDQKIKDSGMGFIGKNESFRELINNMGRIAEMEFPVPAHLDCIMRNYQKTGFKWFKTLAACGFGGILADEMGLGKTLQAIAFLYSVRGEGTSVVVVPTSLIYNWKSEFDKFASDLRVLIVSGNRGVREELIKDIDKWDVVITSYPLLRRDIEEYKDIGFKYCILDEAQQIKNPASVNAASVKELKAEGYFVLTGTPMENSLTEIWSIFDFIMPGYLMSHSKFSRNFETPIIRHKDKAVLEELNRRIRPFILRRLKREVMKELPPKIEHRLIVEMTEEQKKLYAAYLEAAKDELYREIKDRGFNKSRIKILAVLTRLRQICCDPSIFVEDFVGDSGKLMALDDLLEESIGEGHKILLFSQFTSVLKNISRRLDKKNISYRYLDGHTKSEERMKMVKEFNEDDSNIFLISLKAGGTGLNLTGADVVIHFDPWWNPAVEEQATDRAHRIGQEKTVQVTRLVARGTIEEKIYKLQEKKREVISNVINKDLNEGNIISQMTQKELEELFELRVES
jgi:SNF2 family DNA or RNA helicase